MDDIKEVLFRVIPVGMVVAAFLLNTNRALKAIELYKECVNLVDSKVLENVFLKQFVSVVYTTLYFQMFSGYARINKHASAIECGRKLLDLLRESGQRRTEGIVTLKLGQLYYCHGKWKESKELNLKALDIMMETGEKQGEAVCYGNLGIVFQALGEYGKAEEYLEKALAMNKEIGHKAGEATSYGNLGTVFQSVGEYGKAEEYLKKALAIRTEIGDKDGEAADYGNLGTVFLSVGEYGKAKEYLKKALAIRKAIGDKKGEASSYGNLGTVFQSVGEYGKAEEYLKKALAIRTEIGDKDGEAADYGNLGTVFLSVGEYGKAEEYLKKALVIRKAIGDKEGEASSYGNLGTVFQSVGEYGKAEEYLQKALAIRKEIGDKEGEASSYGNLGTVFQSVGEYGKAEEYLKKALAIRTEIGDKDGEAADYGNLGTVFLSVGEYGKAEEYLKEALAIKKEIGDKKGEASSYGNLGTVFQSVGEYCKAEEYLKKALAIKKEIGDKKGEASSYGNLGTVFQSVGEYGKAEEYLKKALVIRKAIGDKEGEASSYGNLGTVFQSFGEYGKAEEYLKKALAIKKEIGDKEGEASCYQILGTVFRHLGECAKAKEYHEKALVMSNDIGFAELQFSSHLNLAWDIMQLGGSIHEVVLNLFLSIQKCEKMRGFLRENDQYKISFLDLRVTPYQSLSALFCVTGNPIEALYVVELGRARALADIMSARYSVQKEISVNPQSWAGIEKIMKKESNCTCLYFSYYNQHLFFWILAPNKTILFRPININDCLFKGLERSVDDVFGDGTRKFNILPQEHCEDRSLFPSIAGHQTRESCQEDSQADCRLIEEDEDDYQHTEPPSLAECYQMIIAPVADLLDEPEIIIVPDRVLYKVPFAALQDESGKCLSEAFRIRIVPSLTTLKLIQDSPADYHSQAGALIVGEPAVSQVHYKGYVEKLCPLPWARKEAEMIGRLLGAQPLIGEHATKQAVLQSIHSVSLVHFAAHGNADRGEIALAPPRPINKISQEEEYLLTMAEISQVRLRAKLVVLSCCHSARGQIRSEGVVGIARAFLGSGARSVLVSLWALQDKATEQFMSRFYEHLVRGESASESLHQAMTWMRGNGFSEVGQWAPFMLIGDNVTFDFGK